MQPLIPYFDRSRLHDLSAHLLWRRIGCENHPTESAKRPEDSAGAARLTCCLARNWFRLTVRRSPFAVRATRLDTAAFTDVKNG